MNCPYCDHPLTPSEIGKLIASLRKPGNTGGPKRSCDCGTCRKCRHRDRMAAYRKNPKQPLRLMEPHEHFQDGRKYFVADDGRRFEIPPR